MKYVSGPHFIYKRDDLKVGEPTPWHAHYWPHNTFVINGVARIEVGESARDVSSTDEEPWVLVPAGVRHRITKLAEGTNVACVFSHFDPTTGKPLGEYDEANNGAYSAHVP